MWNLYTVLHSGCTNLHSNQRYKGAPFSPHTSQHLFFVDFLNNGHSELCEGYLIVVFICIYQMISHAEHCFICVLAICVSLENYLWRSSAHFFIGSFVWYCYISCLYILDINPLLVKPFENFSPFCRLSFYFIPFSVQKLLILIRSHLFCFYFFCLSSSKKTMLWLMSKNFFLVVLWCCVLYLYL